MRCATIIPVLLKEKYQNITDLNFALFECVLHGKQSSHLRVISPEVTSPNTGVKSTKTFSHVT